MRLAMNCCRSVSSTATSSRRQNCGGWGRPDPMDTAMISPRLTRSSWPMAATARQSRDAYAAAGIRQISPDRISQDPGDCPMIFIPPCSPSACLAFVTIEPFRAAQQDFTDRCAHPSGRGQARASITATPDGWEFFVGGGAASLDCNGDRLAGPVSCRRRLGGGVLCQPKRDRRSAFFQADANRI
jgi:hypothetical protein